MNRHQEYYRRMRALTGLAMRAVRETYVTGATVLSAS